MIITPYVPNAWLSEYAAEEIIKQAEALIVPNVRTLILELLKPLNIEQAYNHSEVRETYTSKTAFIYSRLYNTDKYIKCADCPYSTIVKKKLDRTYSELVKIYGVFVDKTGHEPTFCKQVATSDNRVLASYCPLHAILIICDISHYTEIPKKLITEIVNELKEFALPKEKIVDIPKPAFEIDPSKIEVMVSIDGELEIYDPQSDRYIPAERYYRYSGAIGCDGTGVELELRPNPSTNVDEVVNHVKELIKSIDIEYKVRAGSNQRPLGTHIHVSVHHFDAPLYIRNRVPPALRKLIAATLGYPFSKLNNTLYKARIDFGYGDPESIRDTCHSGIEIRAPPSYILYNPKLLKIALKIAQRTFKLWFDNLGKTIELPDIFTKEDYIKYLGLTEEEAEYWYKHLENPDPNVLTLDIRLVWGGYPRPIPLAIEFQENWDNTTKMLLTETIYKILTKLNLSKRLQFKHITLYGLRKRSNNPYPVLVSFGSVRMLYTTECFAEAIRTYFGLPAQVLTRTYPPHYIKEHSLGIGLPPELRGELSRKDIYKLASIIVMTVVPSEDEQTQR